MMELADINGRIEEIFKQALDATYPQQYKILNIDPCYLGSRHSDMMSIYIVRAQNIVDNTVDKFEVMINPSAESEFCRVRVIKSHIADDSRLAIRLSYCISQ